MDSAYISSAHRWYTVVHQHTSQRRRDNCQTSYCHGLSLHQFCTPMIHSCTSAYQPATQRQLSNVLLRVSSTSRPGWRPVQPTPTESQLYPDDVVGFAAAARQGEHLRDLECIVGRQSLGDGAWPECRHWQSAVVVCTGGCCMSQRLLPATATPTNCQIHVIWFHEDFCPGVHFLSHGLLQLTVLGH